jgi:hypothetical protein
LVQPNFQPRLTRNLGKYLDDRRYTYTAVVFIAEVACGRRVFASQDFLEVELYSLTAKNTAEQRILTNGYAAYESMLP